MLKKYLKELLDYVVVIAIAVVISSIISTQVFTFSQVKQSSMESTLIEDDILFVEKLTLHFSELERGDIIVFVNGEDVDNSFVGKIQRLYVDMINKFKQIPNENRLVKRVIGLPGDVVDIQDGKVYVNNEELTENYLHMETLSRIDGVHFPVVVPEGKIFAMGDNRIVSKDSRDFGCIATENVEGVAVFRFFPFNKIGGI